MRKLIVVRSLLPARRRPQGLVVIGVCMCVCVSVRTGQRAGLCPPRTQ